jgi:cytochrome c553
MLDRWIRLAWLASVLAFAAGAGASELSLKDQAAARKVYVAKCAKCHKFYEPKNYSDEDWSKWMASMSRKSRLKPAQSELLNRYLEEYRAGKIPRAH